MVVEEEGIACGSVVLRQFGRLEVCLDCSLKMLNCERV